MTKRPTVIELIHVAVESSLRDGRGAFVHRLGLFTSFDKVQAWARKRFQTASDDGDGLVYYRADEIVLDYAGRVCRSRIYERDGSIRGETSGGVERPWGGRDSAACKFRPGDIVGLVPNDMYRIGVVLAQPVPPEEARRLGKMVTRGDDVYLVGLVNQDTPLDPERYDHEHMAEGELFDPPPDVPEELRSALRQRCLGSKGFPPWPGVPRVR